MRDPFDFATPNILKSELDSIHEALVRQEIEFTPHAVDEADAEQISLVQVLETVFVGTAVSKDLPGNMNGRVPGINFEHNLADGRWIRTKVAWLNGYLVITVHSI
jgi:hypothetical protein